MRWLWWGVGVSVLIAAVGALLFTRWVTSPPAEPLPDRVDAVVVFAGQPKRYAEGIRLAAEGRAPVVVLSLGAQDPTSKALCGQTAPFEVICSEPDPRDTAGEAKTFARLASDQGWSSLLAVTSSYHVRRAQRLLDRCTDASVSFVGVDDGRSTWATVPHELGGFLEALARRSC